MLQQNALLLHFLDVFDSIHDVVWSTSTRPSAGLQKQITKRDPPPSPSLYNQNRSNKQIYTFVFLDDIAYTRTQTPRCGQTGKKDKKTFRLGGSPATKKLTSSLSPAISCTRNTRSICSNSSGLPLDSPWGKQARRQKRKRAQARSTITGKKNVKTTTTTARGEQHGRARRRWTRSTARTKIQSQTDPTVEDLGVR